MRPIDDNLERRIVRSLDHESTTDEDLALERELLRCPEARQIRDDYRRIDDAASNALHAVLDSATPATSWDPRSAGPTRRFVWTWRLAVAASLLLAAGLTLPGLLGPAPEVAGPSLAPTSRPLAVIPVSDRARPAGAPWLNLSRPRYVPETPYQRNRQVQRDFFVIEDDEADRFYLIERNRTRTIIVRTGGSL